MLHLENVEDALFLIYWCWNVVYKWGLDQCMNEHMANTRGECSFLGANITLLSSLVAFYETMYWASIRILSFRDSPFLGSTRVVYCEFFGHATMNLEFF